MKRFFCAPLFCVLALAPAGGVTLSLADEQARALVNSPEIGAAVAALSAAEKNAAVSRSALYPTVNLEGQGYYQTTVFQIQTPAPMNFSASLGNNWNYTVGPAAYWTLWDFGDKRFGYRAAEQVLEAKRRELDSVKRNVLLGVRSAYFKTMLALDQVYLSGNFLKLAVEQYDDTVKKARAGDKTRLDVLQFRQEVYSRRKMYIAARRELSENLNGLFALTGEGADHDTAFPSDERLGGSVFEDVSGSTFYAGAEKFDTLDAAMSPAEKKNAADKNPALLSLAAIVKNYELAEKQAEAKRWLAVQSYAKAQLAFPKGPADISFNQNVAGVNVSMPLWDDGRTKNSAAAQGALADNYKQQYNRARRDIFRDFETARE
ncbi:MAG: TolC family protein, partial [Elusimicrobiaceae bacterium]